MPNYATVQELAAQINKKAVDDDITLTTLLSAAENTINRFCNRVDGFVADTVASARLYSGNDKGYLLIDETPEITAVGAKSSTSDASFTAWATTDWMAFNGSSSSPNFNATPYNGIMVNPNGDYSRFYSGIGHFPMVQVTAKWGWALTVPDDIKEACIMQAARWYKRLEGAMGDALASGDLGQIMYRQKLDPDVAMILVNGRYVRPAVGRR